MTTTSDRRTFAIISHPDAGKTTLTEKLLLSGGAVHQAGEVKARGQARRARSDWMAIEQARGISVTSSVMTFEHDGLTFNLLDTPGHEDFSEDTYRTLTAVDSAVMVIDAARGIEAQTRKLFEVCRLRSVPIITFINKVDREGRSPFELLDEIADQLALDVVPMSWPAGMGGQFEGVWDLRSHELLRPAPGSAKEFQGDRHRLTGLDDPKLADLLTPDALARLREEAELAGAYGEFDEAAYRNGDQTPVWFGSALRDFGVGELIAGLAAHAPGPREQPAEPAPVDPSSDTVTGFVFKVQANMNPQHRDRIAFLRLCSGTFKRGMKLNQVATGKTIAVHSPILFFAQSREVVDEAVAGDIIGIPNHGTLRVGDTLTDGPDVTVTGLPNFAPEILRRVRLHRPHQDQAVAQSARRPGGGGRGAGVQPHAGRPVGGGRGRPVAAGGADQPPGRRVQGGGGAGDVPLPDRPLAGGGGEGGGRLRRVAPGPDGAGPRRRACLPGQGRLGAKLSAGEDAGGAVLGDKGAELRLV